MEKIFSANQSKDNFLKIYIQADDATVNPLNINISSIDFYQFNETICLAEFLVRPAIADTLVTFSENCRQRQTAFFAKIVFNNENNFYLLSPVEFLLNPRGLDMVDGCTPCALVVARQHIKCIIDGKEKPELVYTDNEGVSQNLEIDIDALISNCMQYQEAHKPKPLSPIEQMRLKQKKFKSTISAPSTSPENQPTTNENKEIFDPSSLKTNEGSKNYKADLEKIIGLTAVKREFEKMTAAREFYLNRPDASSHSHSLHMCFVGAPGTGKTTIARIVAGYLYHNQLIKENKFVEISGLDLLGNYLGHTAERTRIILNYAKGGVLFIDEAYAILGSSYGQEAINTLLKEMEDSRSELVVIFAGYEHEMNEFLQMNEGFRSRINRFFRFENYNIEELAAIFMKFLHSKNLLIEPEGLREVLYILNSVCHGDTFSNGRYVRNLIEKIEDAHIFNIRNRITKDNINLITFSDVKSVEL